VNATELATTETLVAVCDVDQEFAEKNAKDKLRPDRNEQVRPQAIRLNDQFGKAAKYADFREMLQKEKGIDGIVVATPDHLHAVVAKAAMDLGKHAYVQKPLTWSVHEARAASVSLSCLAAVCYNAASVACPRPAVGWTRLPSVAR
jgi:predicted dehydrogenase